MVFLFISVAYFTHPEQSFLETLILLVDSQECLKWLPIDFIVKLYVFLSCLMFFFFFLILVACCIHCEKKYLVRLNHRRRRVPHVIPHFGRLQSLFAAFILVADEGGSLNEKQIMFIFVALKIIS